VLYTPDVVNTPRMLQRDLDAVWAAVYGLADRLHKHSPQQGPRCPNSSLWMKPIDSARRGSSSCAICMTVGRSGWCSSVCLVFRKRLGRYAQLYSRVGFVHQFLSLGGAELQGLIRHQSLQLGLGLELHEDTQANVLSSIVRITGGNFRLIERLFAQIERVAQINAVTTLTTELVTAAQESLVIGAL